MGYDMTRYDSTHYNMTHYDMTRKHDSQRPEGDDMKVKA